VGGDLYDFFLLDESRLAFAIGDVCGKGIPASMFMAVALTVLRMSAREETSAEATVARANALLCRDNATSMFATLFYGVLDLRSGALEYCNCGHNAPLILHSEGQISFLPATGVPLGLHAGSSASAKTVRLAPSDLLVLFTDGITEAMNAADEEFTDDRLHETVRPARDLGVNDFIEHIFRDVDAFVQDAEQADDMTCLVLRCTP
jgi:phosphoserine phosphatase RsbU/P